MYDYKFNIFIDKHKDPETLVAGYVKDGYHLHTAQYFQRPDPDGTLVDAIFIVMEKHIMETDETKDDGGPEAMEVNQ